MGIRNYIQVITICICTALLTSCGVSENEQLDENQAKVINGVPAQEWAGPLKDHPAVAAILFREKDKIDKCINGNERGCWAGACTGSVVDRQIMLTAAHCVDAKAIAGNLGKLHRDVVLSENIQLGAFFGVNAQTPEAAEKIVVIEKSVIHPCYPEGITSDLQLLMVLFTGDPHDVALAKLSEPVNVQPMVMNKAPLSFTDLGKKVRLVGYGFTKLGVSGQIECDSWPYCPGGDLRTKNIGEARLLWYSKYNVRAGEYPCKKDENGWLTDCVNIGPGDSGGPVIASSDNLTYGPKYNGVQYDADGNRLDDSVIIGINAYSLFTPVGYSDRVDIEAEWIKTIMDNIESPPNLSCFAFK